MNRRRFLRVGAVGALASTAGCLSTALGVNQGRVVEKGIRAGGKRLVAATPSGVSAVDGYPGNTNLGDVTVNETMVDQLSSYGNPTYEVTIRQYRVAWPNDAKAGERKRYTTYRDLFNRLDVGDHVTFQLDPTDTSSIGSVSYISSDRDSLSARCSSGDEGSGSDRGKSGSP